MPKPIQQFAYLITFLLTPIIAIAADQDDNCEDCLPPSERSCNSGFALCTSAPCIPDPQDPTGMAICTCEVTSGPNYAAKTECGDRDPTRQRVNGNVVTTTVSTYSFVQAATKPVMTCDEGPLWTDCLDAPCTVDPKDPLRAICSCPIVADKGDYVTYGGSCNTNTCKNAVWSAATVRAFQQGSANLRVFMQIDAVPASYCPGQPVPALGE